MPVFRQSHGLFRLTADLTLIKPFFKFERQMMSRSRRVEMVLLCLAVAILAGAAATAGVFFRGHGSVDTVISPRGERYEMIVSGLYRYNAERIVAEGVGWDIFTLFAAVPALLLSLPWLARGTLRSRLFSTGILAYLFYQYLMYSVTWAFGPLFLLFVAIYALSLVAVVRIVSTIDLKEIASRFDERFPTLGMGLFSLAMAALLIVMWLARVIPAMGGKIEGVLLGQTTLVVQALDLGLVVPLALFTGVTALRRRPIGYLLSAVVVVKGTAMAAAICAMLILAWIVEGALEIIPLIVFAATAAVAVWLGLRIYRSILPATST
jgi:hypothetical protein